MPQTTEQATSKGYYYETEHSQNPRRLWAESDKEAVEIAKKRTPTASNPLLVVYREDDAGSSRSTRSRERSTN